MSWERPTGVFKIEPIKPSPWSIMPVSEPPKQDIAYRTDEGLKRLFGIELAKNSKAFEAALVLFPDDTSKALWVSWNWLTDPLVVASKDAYAQNVELNEKLLDKDALAAKLLTFADEKDATGRFYICEAKDRLAALKLYAEVQGFVGKVNIDASTNNFTNNELKLVLVKAEKQTTLTKTIELEEILPTELPSNLKLVSSSR